MTTDLRTALHSFTRELSSVQQAGVTFTYPPLQKHLRFLLDSYAEPSGLNASVTGFLEGLDSAYAAGNLTSHAPICDGLLHFLAVPTRVEGDISDEVKAFARTRMEFRLQGSNPALVTKADLGRDTRTSLGVRPAFSMR